MLRQLIFRKQIAGRFFFKGTTSVISQVKKKLQRRPSITILGNCIYLNAEFEIACVQKKSLIDPKGYVFEVDDTARAKFKTVKYISLAPQLQRHSNPQRHGSLNYHTAIRKYKNNLKKAALKRKTDNVQHRLILVQI